MADAYIRLTQNMNPFSLDRKFNNQNAQQINYRLWEKCVPLDYYKFICQKEKLSNFLRNHNVSTLFPQLNYLNNVCNSDFQRELISKIENNEDLEKHLLASGEIWQHLQEEIDLQVIDGRLNDA